MAHNEKIKVIQNSGPMGFTALLSFIGAAVYFIQQTDGFWNIVLAVLKAIVWPAFAVHRALELMGV